MVAEYTIYVCPDCGHGCELTPVVPGCGPRTNNARHCRCGFRGAFTPRLVAAVPTRDLSIIGRERFLIDKLAKTLHDAARKRHSHAPIVETRRGAAFELRLFASDGEDTGVVARVTVEFDRLADGPSDG